MAIQTFNSVDGFSVGNSQITVIDDVANVSANSLTVTANANIAGTTASTSRTTGALTVAGGAGVAGDLNVGNSIVLDSAGGYGTVTTTQFASMFAKANGLNATSIVQVKGNDNTNGMGMRAVTGSNALIYSNSTIDLRVGSTIRDLDTPTGGTTIASIASTGVSVTGTLSATGNITGNYFIGNGSQLTDLPAGGIEYVYKTSAYTVTTNQGVLANTAGGAFTVTLPATPTTGDQCVVADAGGVFGANNVTVARNGSTIVGIAQDLALDIDGVSVQFIYDGSTWEVYSQVGGAGGAASAYGNTQVSTYLASGTNTAGFTTTGDISSANLTATGSISNSRIVTRVVSTTSGSSLTPNGDTTDQYEVTALAIGATINAPSGTPNDGQRLIIRIDDNGSAQSLSWNAIYRPIGTTLPATTVAGKTLYVGCVYNTNKTKWDVVAVSQEA